VHFIALKSESGGTNFTNFYESYIDHCSQNIDSSVTNFYKNISALEGFIDKSIAILLVWYRDTSWYCQ